MSVFAVIVLQALGNFWSLVSIRREGRNKFDREGKELDEETANFF